MSQTNEIFILFFPVSDISEQTELIQTFVQRCMECIFLCDELYLQAIKQTTDHPGK